MEASKLEYIHSKDNKTLKHAISLQQRKNRQKYSEYLVEGIRLTRDLISKNNIVKVLIKESKSLHPEIKGFIENHKHDVTIFIVQDPLFEKIEGTVNTQGIMGIAKKHTYDLESISITDGLYLAIDGVQDPGNLGTIIRTSVAAGVKGIFLLKGTVDVYNEKCVRSTMSALHNIPIYEDVSLSSLYDVIKDNKITTYATSLEESKSYDTVTYAKRTMIIVGNEGNGISDEVLNMAEHRISIPMYGPIESLNVSIATALCLYKVREQI